MPLEVQIKTNNYKFEIMNLPFEAQDFDFETYKSFSKGGKDDDSPDGKGGKDEGQLKRKNSEETIITQRT